MADNVTLTVELDRALWERLCKLGAETQRDSAGMARDAIAAFVQDEEEVLAAIEEGIADHRAGRSIPHEQVDRWLRSWGKPDELPPPTCK